MYYKVSKKEMAQLALNSLKEILKRRKSISDLLVMALPERVVAGLSTPSSSSMNARMTSLDSSLSPQCNHFHSPHHCCFRFHRCRLHHYRCYHGLTKVPFQLRVSFYFFYFIFLFLSLYFVVGGYIVYSPNHLGKKPDR